MLLTVAGAEEHSCMDMMTWLLLSALLLAAGVMAWRRWGSRSLPARRRNGARLAAEVIRVHGAQRCLRAITLLEDLSAAEDEAALISAWELIELPLVEALPDCPPKETRRLIIACEAASSLSTNRDIAKRIMTLRNSLVK